MVTVCQYLISAGVAHRLWLMRALVCTVFLIPQASLLRGFKVRALRFWLMRALVCTVFLILQASLLRGSKVRAHRAPCLWLLVWGRAGQSHALWSHLCGGTFPEVRTRSGVGGRCRSRMVQCRRGRLEAALRSSLLPCGGMAFDTLPHSSSRK